MSAFDAINPDHLVALLAGHEEEDRESDHRAGRHTKDKQGPTILDSLAHLAVCREEGQNISIGAVQVGKNIELVVADNGPVDEAVISFLQHFLGSLSNVRKRMTRIPPVDADSGQQLEGELRALKVMVLRHNMPKLRVRFFKHYFDFQQFFYHFVEDEDQPKSMQSEEPFLTKTYRTIAKLRQTLDSLSTTSDDFVLNAIKGIYFTRVDRPGLFSSCTDYINRVPSLEKFDVLRWFDKITTSHVHFDHAARLSISSSMGGFLEMPLNITALDNVPKPITFSVTRDAFVKLFESMNWTADGDDGFSEDDVFDAIRNGFKRSHPPSNNEKPLKKGMRVECLDDEIRFDLILAVHSECVVLEHLKCRPNAIPFVGVSKLSCIPCHLYYDLGSSIFHTTGTHSLFPPTWRCPTNDSEIRAGMCKLLLPKLFNWAQLLEHQQKELLRSQSTNASVENIAIVPTHEAVESYLDSLLEGDQWEENNTAKRQEHKQAAQEKKDRKESRKVWKAELQAATTSKSRPS